MLDDALDHLRRLIAFPTVAGRPNRELIDYVAERLEAVGAWVSVIPAQHRSDAVNLHAVLGPVQAPGGLLLSGHSDVVATDGQPWSRDPFELQLEADRAYGRGTTDMKGFLATVLSASAIVGARSLRRPMHIAISSDEELGCLGAPALIDAIAARLVQPAGAVVGEPTGMRVVDRHKAKVALRIEVHGRAAHSSLPSQGANAVAMAARLITRLADLQAEIVDGACFPGYVVPHDTVGVGPIHGGVALNIVPDHCRFDVDIRAVDGHDPRRLVKRVEGLAWEVTARAKEAAAEVRVTVDRIGGYPGLAPDRDSDFTRHVADFAGQPGAGAADYGTEAGLFQQRLGIPVVVCGPGDMRDAHRSDESVALAQLEASERLVLRLAQELR